MRGKVIELWGKRENILNKKKGKKTREDKEKEDWAQNRMEGKEWILRSKEGKKKEKGKQEPKGGERVDTEIKRREEKGKGKTNKNVE